MPSH
jgi:DegV: EDD domain protein, DegV family